MRKKTGKNIIKRREAETENGTQPSERGSECIEGGAWGSPLIVEKKNCSPR